MAKTLIAYYSRSGNNYANGRIVHLPVGNTEVIAKKIREITGGELFEIKTSKPYPDDYTEATKVARNELSGNARPELSASVNEMDSYDLIYLGYPNWWGTMPMAVFTFLESYDFSGKTIMPFCTHEGSGMGNSEHDIKRICNNVNMMPGLAIRGSAVKSADGDVASWIKKYDIINNVFLTSRLMKTIKR